MAYAELEPFGPVQEDYRAARMPTLFYNVNRKEGTAPLDESDFFRSLKLPTTEAEADEKDRIQQLWRMRLWEVMHSRKAKPNWQSTPAIGQEIGIGRSPDQQLSGGQNQEYFKGQMGEEQS